MRKAGITVKFLTAIAGLLIAGAVWAQGPQPAPGGPGMGMGRGPMGHRPPMERSFGGHGVEGRWWNNPKIAEKLKLTDDQCKTFDNILQSHREKLIDLRANMQKAELTMAPLMHDDHPNESAILAQIDKVAQARAELEKANARYLLAIRSKLTPEQWKSIQDFRANRGDREMRNGGRGWNNGSGPQGPRHVPHAPRAPRSPDAPQAPVAPEASPSAQ